MSRRYLMDSLTGKVVLGGSGRRAGIMGFSHVDLTVADCDRAVQWWQDVLGFMLVHQVHEATYQSRAMDHPSGVAVTVMTHDTTAESGAFDGRRIHVLGGTKVVGVVVCEPDRRHDFLATSPRGRNTSGVPVCDPCRALPRRASLGSRRRG